MQSWGKSPQIWGLLCVLERGDAQSMCFQEKQVKENVLKSIPVRGGGAESAGETPVRDFWPSSAPVARHEVRFIPL